MATENSGLIRPYSNALVELSRGLDAILIVASLWLTTRWLGVDWSRLYTTLSLLAALAFITTASINQMYRSWRSDPIYVESIGILQCWVIAAIVTAGAAYGMGTTNNFSQELAWRWFLVAPLILVCTRISVRMAFRLARIRGHNFRRTAIVGSTRIAAQLAEEIEGAPWLGLRFVGFYDDRDPRDERVHPALTGRIIGTIDDLVRAAEDGDVDNVYVTLPLRAELRIKEIIDRLSELPLSVFYVPDFFVFNMLHAQWQRVGNFQLVKLITTPFLGVSGLTKRLEDIVLSSLILVIIAVPFAIIAAAVKMSSPGPVIFRQRRYGLNGNEFEIWKFRTMTVVEDGADVVQAVPNDPRITPVGSFLRKSSLDELPQFINCTAGSHVDCRAAPASRCTR